MSTVLSILGAVLLLGVLIIVHELGHFFAGRLLKLPVTEFSVGFGPLLFGRERNGIQYSIRALPFGGYCAFDDEETDGRPSFLQAAAWRRLLTFLAGPAMNLFLAYILAVVYLSTIGMAAANVIYSVEDGMPAQAAGLREGDVIVAVDGQETLAPIELIRQKTDDVALTVARDGERVDLRMIPIFDEEADAYRVGITLSYSYIPYSLPQSIRLGAVACYDMSATMIDYLAQLVTGRQDAGELVGIVGTVTMISTQTQQGFAHSLQSGFSNLLNMAILIALNLGLINLLPLPALDGGRIIFALIEMIVRRPVPQKVESIIHTAGFVLLFGLMIVLVFKDVLGLIRGTLPI